MARFISQELKQQFESCREYVDDFERHGGIYFEFQCANEEDDDGIIIDENYIIFFTIDYEDTEQEITLKEFIQMVNCIRNTELYNNLMYSYGGKSIVRVGVSNIEEYYKFDSMLNDYNKVLINKVKYMNYDIICSIKRKDTLFTMFIAKTGEFDKYRPCWSEDEYFIEIKVSGNKKLEKNELEEIYQSYLFEINTTYKFGLVARPRPEVIEDYDETEEEQECEYKLRPLMFGNGVKNVIRMYNRIEDNQFNYDFSIQEYTKIIEYVSQTVIRQEIIEEANKKLYSPKALKPDANYIKELEDMFIGHKNKYATDRNAIKATIRKCCDVTQLIEHAPKCLNKINTINERLSKAKSKKEEIINELYDLLSDVISDTRNSISHAKANYNPTGKECPENEKQDYIEMLKLISVQVIRWFYTVNESSRII